MVSHRPADLPQFGQSPLREMLNAAWQADQQRKWMLSMFPLPVEEPRKQARKETQ